MENKKLTTQVFSTYLFQLPEHELEWMEVSKALSVQTIKHTGSASKQSSFWLHDRPFMSKLTDEETDRNKTKLEQLYFHSTHALAAAIKGVAAGQKDIFAGQRHEHKQAIDPKSTKERGNCADAGWKGTCCGVLSLSSDMFFFRDRYNRV